MLRGKLAATFRSVIVAALILSFSLLPDPSVARDAVPELIRPRANPSIVHLGSQPAESPLILSVETGGTGGAVSAITVNVGGLLDARYYDPVSHTVKETGLGVPMMRVYEIEGSEAYLVAPGARHELNEYRKVVTHERVRGTAEASDKWQVELPHAGRAISDFELAVTALNGFNQRADATIRLKVVDDTVAPEVTARARLSINSPVTRRGDEVSIEAQVTDAQSGVFSVRLDADSAEAVFGENAKTALTRVPNSSTWSVRNTVDGSAPSGTYNLNIIAVDRAGNQKTNSVRVQVAEEIRSLQIELVKGWNMISVPRKLQNQIVAEVFAGLPVESVLTWSDGKWLEPSEIRPGPGYLVKVGVPTTLEVRFGDVDSSTLPQVISLVRGWNLIGYVSPSLHPMMPLTFYLGKDLKDRWLVLYNAEGEQARPQSASPYVWATNGFPTITGEPYAADVDDNLPRVELGKAYWVYLTGEGTLVP